MASVRVYLKPEGHPSLSSMFLGRELCRDAVDFDKDSGVPGWVPEKADRVEGRRLLLHVGHPVAQRCIYLKDPFVWMCPARRMNQLFQINLFVKVAEMTTTISLHLAHSAICSLSMYWRRRSWKQILIVERSHFFL